MEDIGLKEKLLAFGKKYRYVMLVCMIGICLMMIPEKGEELPAPEERTQQQEPVQTTAQRLSEILGKLKGAGKVEVMLTTAAGEQTIYQTDTHSGTSGDLKIQTVIVTTSDKKQTGLIRQVLPETYLGAIVLCQGADNPAVCLAIVEAVSDVTGLSTDKISVLKMK